MKEQGRSQSEGKITTIFSMAEGKYLLSITRRCSKLYPILDQSWGVKVTLKEGVVEGEKEVTVKETPEW